MCDAINWARLLAFVTGLVNQELLLRNEYLTAENRILRAHLPIRLQFSDPERCTLAEIGKRLGRKGLKQVACTAKPNEPPAASVSYAAFNPKISRMNWICPRTSPFGNHLTWPFRIM